MQVGASRAAISRLGIGTFIVMAALVFGPPLVRAADHIGRGSTSSLIRLNRGFEHPPTKWTLVSPHDCAEPVSVSQSGPSRVSRRTAASADSRPNARPAKGREILRGPPPSHLI
jgi:hypothetical protein